jgi:hypothetical protein
LVFSKISKIPGLMMYLPKIATLEGALRREDLRGEFLEYLVKVVAQETGALREVAATEEK